MAPPPATPITKQRTSGLRRKPLAASQYRDALLIPPKLARAMQTAKGDGSFSSNMAFGAAASPPKITRYNGKLEAACNIQRLRGTFGQAGQALPQRDRPFTAANCNNSADL